MKIKNRIPVLYILGGGHSGSTVLSMILGSSQEVFNAGELKFYSKHTDPNFSRWREFKNECSCGESSSSCPFWSGVEQASPGLEIAYHTGLRGYFQAAFNHIFSNNSNWIKNDSILFTNILNAAKALEPDTRIVLDNSKNLHRLIQLTANPDFDVYPIFLVRDGRGYMNSYHKRHQRGYFLWLLQWAGVNLITLLYLKFTKIPYCSLSYDRFTLDPDEYLEELNEQYQINIPADYSEALNQAISHVRAGNAAVLGKRKFEGLHNDKSWETELPTHILWISSIIARPLNRLFGV